MEIRRARPNDAEVLAKHRAAVWREVGGWTLEVLAPQVPVWSEFFERTIAQDAYAGAIAERDGVIVGSGGILVHRAMPRPGGTSEHAGRVQSVYVVAHARRQGIARAIMENLIAYGRERGLISLGLHPSDEGRPLYASLGFEPADEMLLRFTKRA